MEQLFDFFLRGRYRLVITLKNNGNNNFWLEAYFSKKKFPYELTWLCKKIKLFMLKIWI